MIGDILNFVEQVGIPISSALAVGWFFFIILKFLLLKLQTELMEFQGRYFRLENKVDVMNNDIVKIDAQFSCAFGCEPNLNRIAASEGL